MADLENSKITTRNLYLSSLFVSGITGGSVNYDYLKGGGIGGFVVDMVLFPLDTLKTRLQSAKGFQKSGGFNGIYKGIGPQAIGSAPQAALFFLTYESFKFYVEPVTPSVFLPGVYMIGASISEVVACLIRVPMEVVKQRRQTTRYTSFKILIHAYKTEGFRKGLYRGFGSMILREVPFSFIQFPILEYLKTIYRGKFKDNIPLESWEVAICGAIAGGVAAALTTPLDVAKTRIMLSHKSNTNLTVRFMLKSVYNAEGLKGLFAGFIPRVLWITMGGYIFFGTYDFAKNFCSDTLLQDSNSNIIRR